MNGTRMAVLVAPSGAGKTTAALKVVDLVRARGRTCGGFASPARLGSQSEKVGIDVLDIQTGERRLLATAEGALAGHHIGPFSFDSAGLDWGSEAFARGLKAGCDLLIADELGPLELEQGEGFAPVIPLLAGGHCRRSLVVVRPRLVNQWLAMVSGVEVETFFCTPGVRNRLPEDMIAWVFGEA